MAIKSYKRIKTRYSPAKWGRPKINVDLELLRCLREVEHLGWLRIEREYQKRTGQKVSKDTLKRRYWDDYRDRVKKRPGFKMHENRTHSRPIISK